MLWLLLLWFRFGRNTSWPHWVACLWTNLRCDAWRHFGFDPKKLSTPSARLFRQCVESIAGLNGKGMSSLLTSLPSELMFNDLRDSVRRSKKSEKTLPSNLHSAAWRSAATRNKSCSAVELQDADWASPLPFGGKGCTMKTSVCSSLRSTDKQLGVSVYGLTRVKNSKYLTKPHIFAARLAMFNMLCSYWHQCQGSNAEKAKAIEMLVKSMWICKLVQRHMFIRIKKRTDTDECEDDDSKRMLVISSDHAGVQVLRLEHSEEHDCFCLASRSFSGGCTSFFLQDLQSIEAQTV